MLTDTRHAEVEYVQMSKTVNKLIVNILFWKDI